MSNRFLKLFNEGAVTTLSGNPFHVSTTLRLKKACLVSVLQYTFFNLYGCPLVYSSRGVVASAPDFERADEGSILTAGLCFKSGKSECNNSGYKLTGLTWWP